MENIFPPGFSDLRSRQFDLESMTRNDVYIRNEFYYDYCYYFAKFFLGYNEKFKIAMIRFIINVLNTILNRFCEE